MTITYVEYLIDARSTRPGDASRNIRCREERADVEACQPWFWRRGRPRRRLGRDKKCIKCPVRLTAESKVPKCVVRDAACIVEPMQQGHVLVVRCEHGNVLSSIEGVLLHIACQYCS